MKLLKLTLLLVLTTLLPQNTEAQKNEQIITQVEFDQEGNIILNKEIAYKYSKNDNDFVISDLQGKEIIKGRITSLGKGKFSSIITFIEVNTQFSHPKIIGRNDLIFALCENNIIEKDFKLNIERLNKFIKKYNQL